MNLTVSPALAQVFAATLKEIQLNGGMGTDRTWLSLCDMLTYTRDENKRLRGLMGLADSDAAAERGLTVEIALDNAQAEHTRLHALYSFRANPPPLVAPPPAPAPAVKPPVRPDSAEALTAGLNACRTPQERREFYLANQDKIGRAKALAANPAATFRKP